MEMKIQQTRPDTNAEILALYPKTFPEEDLTGVVAGLLECGTQVLSLAAYNGDGLAGHVVFTLGGTREGEQGGALLGPLGVLPEFQGQGIGLRLVRAGLEHLEKSDVRQIFVLGDPGYYQRFGFETESRVLAPYPLSREYRNAWQSMRVAGRDLLEAGMLILPEPWMKQALWSDEA